MEIARYRNVAMDSARWEGFALRDGDIVISTPPKCGTTWTQMICALLIFQTPELPQPLDLLSPWLDMVTRTIEDVRADLDAQTHRRFIKSHTPLDGLPWDERVTYITSGRDPRDVAISWDNHFGNMNLEEFFKQRQRAVGLEDVAEFFPDGFPEFPAQEIDRFWQWMGAEPTQGGLVDLVHHLDTFWRRRDEPNVILLHYAELQADLEGEMRKLASRLAIVVEEERWPELVSAATFEAMRGQAEMRAPNATDPIWNDTKRFFNKGTSGQWHALLDDEGERRYRELVAAKAEPDLLAWLHRDG